MDAYHTSDASLEPAYQAARAPALPAEEEIQRRSSQSQDQRSKKLAGKSKKAEYTVMSEVLSAKGIHPPALLKFA